MGALLGFFAVLVSVVIIVVLLFGLIQCRKNHFMAGFYFFLILIFLKIYDFFAPYAINRFIQSYDASRSISSPNMSIGEMLTLLNFIPRTLEIIAYLFLVVGLYQMWKTRTNNQETEKSSML